MGQYQYQIYGSAHDLFPMETHFGLFTLLDNSISEIPQQYPFYGPWGEYSVENITIREEMPLPKLMEILYLSVIEENFYYLKIPINPQILERLFDEIIKKTGSPLMKLIVGMAPYGGISLWLGNDSKKKLLGWIKGCKINVTISEFLPERDDLTLTHYCHSYVENDPFVKENLEKKGLPPRDLFDKYMQQFTYRYLALFGHWDKDKKEWQKYSDEEVVPELDYIEEALFDGTHDKLHDGGLMNYHEAGKPKKLVVKWHIKKSEYTAYFWFEDEEIRAIFDQFYGAHPDAKADFLIQIDPEHNKYELALYRYGLKEPLVISESAYQLIVFKNKFECFRSENYDQPRGAWIW